VIEPAAPAIALLAGRMQKRQLLQEVLEGFGYRVIFAGEPDRLDCAGLEAINADAWLLELADESELADWLLEHSPANLPVAFVDAQHIDAGFESQLPMILGRQNAWRVINCVSGAHLHEGEVLVAPIKRSLGFAPEGQIRLSDTPWPGPYQPSIETLLDAVAGSFAPACGAIIFSGMGEDGVQACGRLRDKGIQVWTQDAASAACAVMPQAVIDAGYSSRQGSPETLADALRYWLAQEWPVAL
jgi:chemosensory pili system protein ChpB (putative protein-glutamate methylesterase)